MFAFCVALAASNAHAGVRAAVRGVHGAEAADELSDYYVSSELARTTEGLDIAVPVATWSTIGGWSVGEMVVWLRAVVGRAKLARYRKATRGPKKPKPRRTRFARKKHIATARLLRDEQT